MIPLRKFSTGILAAIGALYLLATLTPIDGWWLSLLIGPWNDPTGEILIVPGADILQDGTLGESSYMRSVYAARAWKAGGFKQLVISGGRSGAPNSIASSMRDFVICQGVPASVIRIEELSENTHENALFTAHMLASEPGRKILLTSDYHMFRAIRAFRKAGLNIEPRPFPDAAKRINFWERRWPVFVGLSVESVKIGYYKLRGWI